MYNICHTCLENTTAAGNNYKELYDCKWVPITLTNSTLYTLVFKFLQIFWPDDGLPRPKLVAKINKILDSCV
jgi:hypothetical protein